MSVNVQLILCVLVPFALLVWAYIRLLHKPKVTAHKRHLMVAFWLTAFILGGIFLYNTAVIK